MMLTVKEIFTKVTLKEQPYQGEPSNSIAYKLTDT